MTTMDKYRRELEMVPADSPHLNLMKRMLTSIEGQAEAYKKLQEAHADLVDKVKALKSDKKMQAYKSLCLETLMVKLYTKAEVSGEGDDYRKWAMEEMQPYLTVAGYDFEKQRFGVDE